MDDLKNSFLLLQKNTKKVLENYTFLMEENQFLIDKIAQLEKQLTQEKQLISDLENKNETLTIAKTIEGSKEDRRLTKLKINTLIREIDACIAQLSS